MKNVKCYIQIHLTLKITFKKYLLSPLNIFPNNLPKVKKQLKGRIQDHNPGLSDYMTELQTILFSPLDDYLA